TWLVNFAQNVAGPESMTMTAAPLSVVYHQYTGANEKDGYFLIQQNNDFVYNSSSISYATSGKTGTAAEALGLANNSSTCGSPASGFCAIDSTPGEIVMSASGWMSTFITDNPNDPFYSFQAVWDPRSS